MGLPRDLDFNLRCDESRVRGTRLPEWMNAPLLFGQ